MPQASHLMPLTGLNGQADHLWRELGEAINEVRLLRELLAKTVAERDQAWRQIAEHKEAINVMEGMLAEWLKRIAIRANASCAGEHERS
jgi:hypothetical protein